jgi:transcriptional regulator with XRE-family HTH domain
MPPYQKFGKVLHSLRRKYHITSTELCGALEISEEYLASLERGNEHPSEDLIELMISHFSLDDQLADNLWLLAGYPLERLEDVTVQIAQLPMSELKISYTDMVHISVNNFGVVLNFMQNVSPNNQPLVVSRLGMSKEHAKSVADLIYRTLDASKNPKSKNVLELPIPKHDKRI